MIIKSTGQISDSIQSPVKRKGSSVSSLSGMGGDGAKERKGSMSSGEVEDVLKRHQVGDDELGRKGDNKTAMPGVERDESRKCEDAESANHDRENGSQPEVTGKRSYSHNVSISDSGIHV